MKYARATRAKILFSNVKYANLWGFGCRRRRGCLSSLLLFFANKLDTSIVQIQDKLHISFFL